MALRTNQPRDDRPLTFRPLLGDDENAVAKSNAVKLDKAAAEAAAAEAAEKAAAEAAAAKAEAEAAAEAAAAKAAAGGGDDGAAATTLSALFCRRCFVYDCALHGSGAENQPRPRWRWAAQPPPSQQHHLAAEPAAFEPVALTPDELAGGGAPPAAGEPTCTCRLALDPALAADGAAPTPKPASKKRPRGGGLPGTGMAAVAATPRDAELLARTRSLFGCGGGGLPGVGAASAGKIPGRKGGMIPGRAGGGMIGGGGGGMIPGRPVDGAAGAGCSNGPVGGGCGGGRRRAAQRTVDLRVALEKDGGELRDSQHRGCDCAPGTCDDTNPDCLCIASLNFCEVYCACGPSCRNRFYGCKCTKDCATMACPCFRARRECDAALCVCSAGTPDASGCAKCMPPPERKRAKTDRAETPDPTAADDAAAASAAAGPSEMNGEEAAAPSGEEVAAPSGRARPRGCRNNSLQLGRSAKLMVGPSAVAGWGAFARETIEKGQFISEYLGELVSQEEADRRGQIYDRRASSYLFNLNAQQVVDACPKGNRSRFANHSDQPNARTSVMLARGDHRIALYAQKRIAPGEEVTFDYRYGDKKREEYGFKGRRRRRKRAEESSEEESSDDDDSDDDSDEEEEEGEDGDNGGSSDAPKKGRRRKRSRKRRRRRRRRRRGSRARRSSRRCWRRRASRCTSTSTRTRGTRA